MPPEKYTLGDKSLDPISTHPCFPMDFPPKMLSIHGQILIATSLEYIPKHTKRIGSEDEYSFEYSVTCSKENDQCS
jgi:hypothetical protein